MHRVNSGCFYPQPDGGGPHSAPMTSPPPLEEASADPPQPSDAGPLAGINTAVFSELGVYETFFRDKQKFLETKGYMLRPRYHPDWVPSWEGTDKYPYDCEDSVYLPFRGYLIDARRIRDGKLVYIKRVKTDDEESAIARLLSSEENQKDPRNNTVEMLDYFPDDEDETMSYLVMPYLLPMDFPPFQLVNDVVTFCDQMLEGLVFLHEKGIAHRDCSERNVLMDAGALFPKGFHPVRKVSLPDLSDGVKPLPRYTRPIRFYYIDFGISVNIPPDVQPKLATGQNGLDQDPPELHSEAPYNPFKLDVFIIGNLIRQQFFDVFSNVEFLQPLINSMTQADPSLRPDAADALQHWKNIRKRIWAVKRYWGLKKRDAPVSSRITSDAVSFFRIWTVPYRKAAATPGGKRAVGETSGQPVPG